MTEQRLARRSFFSPRGLLAALGGAPAAPPRPAPPPTPLMSLLAGAPMAQVPGAQVRSALGRSAPPPRALPVLRPPGAVDEVDFLRLCTRCEACIDACPHDAILHAPVRLRAAAGTPVIDPLESPCRMCADVPCVTACPTGALRPDAPRILGRAVIGAQDCLAFQGTSCSVCVERCPVPGAMRLEAGRPVIDAARCTGCGVCQHVCPSPRNAVIVLPALRRGGAA